MPGDRYQRTQSAFRTIGLRLPTKKPRETKKRKITVYKVEQPVHVSTSTHPPFPKKLSIFGSALIKTVAAGLIVPTGVYLGAIPHHCAPVEQLGVYACAPQKPHEPHIDGEAPEQGSTGYSSVIAVSTNVSTTAALDLTRYL